MTVIWDADQSLSVRVVRERLDYLAADGEDPAYRGHVRDGDPLVLTGDALAGGRVRH